MDWFHLEAEFAVHPKVVDLSDQAFRVHVETLGLVARLETDGAIKLRWSNPPKEVVEELVGSGLWDRQGKLLVVHDWSDWNPSHQDMLARRDAGRKAARIRWDKAKGKAPANPSSNGSSIQTPIQRESKSKRELKVYSEAAYRLADLLRKLITENGSKPQGTREKWAHHADLILRRDGRSLEEAEALIRWCQEPGNFWRKVIQSTEGLRRNYDKARIQREDEQRKPREPGSALLPMMKDVLDEA